MKNWELSRRQVWSCRLWERTEEDESARLEEELKGKHLHYIADAITLQQYIRLSSCSQEEAAKRLGRSQSSVANRLRLLRLPEDVLTGLEKSELTERHGRALLRLEKPELQRQALSTFLREKMCVSAAESYVDALVSGKGTIRCAAIEDISVLFTALNKDLATLRKYGISVVVEQSETPSEKILSIHIGKNPAKEKTLEKS